jgi:hypothetical protein
MPMRWPREPISGAVSDGNPDGVGAFKVMA